MRKPVRSRPATRFARPQDPLHRRSGREWLALYRRPLAACLAALSVACALSALAPKHTPTRTVVVAARDLPAGQAIAASDLALRELASEALPPDVAADAGQVVGGRLAVPLRSGSPVALASLVGPGLLTGAPPGTVAVPVRPSDAETVSLIAPGQLVDVVLSTGNGYEQPVESAVIASALPVLWTGDTASGGGWLGAESSPGMVVLAASAAESAVLAGAASRGRIFLVLVAGDGVASDRVPGSGVADDGP